MELGDIIGDTAMPDDAQRIVNVLTEMQRGINTLTDILAQHVKRIDLLEMRVGQLKARTDAPTRSSILRVN